VDSEFLWSKEESSLMQRSYSDRRPGTTRRRPPNPDPTPHWGFVEATVENLYLQLARDTLGSGSGRAANLDDHFQTMSFPS